MSSKAVVPAVAALAGVVAILALKNQTSKKSVVAPVPPAPETGTVSYIAVKSTELEKSKQFYEALGFRILSENQKVVILEPPSRASTQPVLLLELVDTKTEDHAPRKESCADAGYGRMCLAVEDVNKEIERLKALGFEPIAPAVTDRPGDPSEKNAPVTIVGYADPDNNIVELVSMSGGMAAVLKTLKFFGVAKFPLWVHVNINATSFEKSWEAYQLLGFTMSIDYKRVVNRLYQALAIPDPGIAKQVSLVKPPKGMFNIDLIEWENPVTKPISKHGQMLFSLTVDDVALAMDKFTASGYWTMVKAPAFQELPSPLGPAIRSTMQDPDGAFVDLVMYPRENTKQPSLLTDLVTSGTDNFVLITGCDSGFGRSLALNMAGFGLKVVAACYTEKGAQYLQDIATTVVVADLTTESGLEDVIDATRAAVGSSNLWAVVNNAGMCMPGNVEWMSPSVYKKVMDLNFHAPVTLIKSLTPLLRQSKGRIVNVTSVCGMVSAPSNSTYSASKFALEAVSDALRAENRSFGVDVIVVQPGTMRTPLAMAWSDQWLENYNSARAEDKSMHPEAWAKHVYEFSKGELEKNAEDPLTMIQAMVDALTMRSPPTRIRPGSGAQAYYILSCLPDRWRDAIFTQFSPPPQSFIKDEN